MFKTGQGKADLTDVSKEPRSEKEEERERKKKKNFCEKRKKEEILNGLCSVTKSAFARMSEESK